MPVLSDSLNICTFFLRRLILASVVLLAFDSRAQSPTENEVKAVFIYNFLNFIEWPPSSFEKPSDAFVIGVAGDESFHNLLKQVVAGEKYQNHAIELRTINEGSQARECHLVYVEKTHAKHDEILNATSNVSVLTVGNSNEFLATGGVIRFFVQDNKVKLEINAKAAKTNDLKISSKLLRLASIYDQ